MGSLKFLKGNRKLALDNYCIINNPLIPILFTSILSIYYKDYKYNYPRRIYKIESPRYDLSNYIHKFFYQILMKLSCFFIKLDYINTTTKTASSTQNQYGCKAVSTSVASLFHNDITVSRFNTHSKLKLHWKKVKSAKISKRFGSAFEKCLKLAKSIFLAEEGQGQEEFFLIGIY